MSAGVLDHLQGRLRASRLANLLMLLWLLLLGGGLGLILFDAVLVLPAALRVQLPWLLPLLMLPVLGAGLIARGRLNATRVARSCERHDPGLGTSLTNAVQLEVTTGRPGIEELLRRQAVARGRKRARRVPIWPLVRRSLLAGGLAVLALALLVNLAPRAWPELFAAVLPRFLAPHADHPPYSDLDYRMSLSERQVLYGGQCEVTATVAGGQVEKLYLVAESTDGPTRSVMFRRPDGSYGLTLTNLREDCTVHVTDGRGRSHRHRLTIRYTPRIERVDYTARFPTYTGRADHERRLPDEDLALPRGTRVGVSVASNRPLAGGELVLTPLLGGEARILPLRPREPGARVVHADFTVEAGCAFHLGVSDVDGLASTDSRRGRILIEPDRRPRIQVTEPGRDAVATPAITVPVAVSAEDDFGVAQILWLRAFNGGRETVAPVALDGTGRRVRATTALDLADLGVRPGDRVEYFFEAVDNYPDGPNVTTSRIFSLEIISEERYREYLRQRNAQEALLARYQALDAQLRRIAERARHLADQAARQDADGGPDADEHKAQAKELAALREELADHLDRRRKLAGDPRFYDVEEAFQDSLAAQAPRLARAKRRLGELADAAGRGGSPSPSELDELAELLTGLHADTRDQVGQPAHLIASVARIMAAANRFAALAQTQERQARLARRFAEQPDTLSRIQQMELQELAASERQIRESLTAITDELPDLLAALPDEARYHKLAAQVRGFLDAVEELEIDAELAGAAGAFGALDGPNGLARARTAAEKMLSLIAKCNEGIPQAGQQCLSFQPMIQQAMGDTLAQITSAMNGVSTSSGASGYGLYGHNIGLYGPAMELAGSQAGGRGRGGEGRSGPSRSAAVGDATGDPLLPDHDRRVRVELQHQAAFPLRYRRVVGEYFRVIAESQEP